jgi:hypothetical protein
MDESQWLPKGVEIINPERRSMLGIHVEYDVEGVVKYARANMHPNILQYLHQQHILDDLEYENGRDYQQWREMFRAFCSNQRMTANYGEMRITCREGYGIRESAYGKLIRQLPVTHSKAIDYAIDTETTPILEKQARRLSEDYQRVFNRLGAVMDIIREEMLELA